MIHTPAASQCRSLLLIAAFVVVVLCPAALAQDRGPDKGMEQFAAALRAHDFATADRLIEWGAILNPTKPKHSNEYWKRLPLVVAVDLGDEEVTRYLLGKGADPFAVWKPEGSAPGGFAPDTALSAASYARRVTKDARSPAYRVFRALVLHPPSAAASVPNSPARSEALNVRSRALLDFVAVQDLEALRVLSEAGLHSPEAMTRAAETGNVAAVKAMVEGGGPAGDALGGFVKAGDVATVQWLLEHRAHPDRTISFKGGYWPLVTVAAYVRSERLVTLLLEHRASAAAKNSLGMTYRDVQHAHARGWWQGLDEVERMLQAVPSAPSPSSLERYRSAVAGVTSSIDPADEVARTDARYAGAAAVRDAEARYAAAVRRQRQVLGLALDRARAWIAKAPQDQVLLGEYFDRLVAGYFRDAPSVAPGGEAGRYRTGRLAEGKALFNDGRLRDALRIFESLQAQHPHDAEIREWYEKTRKALQF